MLSVLVLPLVNVGDDGRHLVARDRVGEGPGEDAELGGLQLAPVVWWVSGRRVRFATSRFRLRLV